MRSATERLPSLSTLLTSWVTSGEPYTGSEINGRFGAGPLRGISALLLLRAVAAAGLLAVLDALGVQRTADDLAQRRVRLLGRGGVDAGAHAAPLRTPLERRSLLLGDLVLAALADQLLDRGHRPAFSCVGVSCALNAHQTLCVLGLSLSLRIPRSGVSPASGP